MKIEKSTGITFIVLLLLVLNVYILFYIMMVTKKLEYNVSILNEIKISQKAVEKSFEELNLEMDENKEIQRLLMGKIDKTHSESLKQFNTTKKMKTTYDELLAEQKKLTVDISSKDSFIAKLLLDANAFYEKKDYAAAYKNYSNILLYQPDNNQIRLKKMCSLFYLNPMNNSSYIEIREDIRILKNNGFDTLEVLNIEKIVEK